MTKVHAITNLLFENLMHEQKLMFLTNEGRILLLLLLLLVASILHVFVNDSSYNSMQTSLLFTHIVDQN